MRRLRLQRDDPTRKERARDWERTARVALLTAIGVGLLAAATSPRWAVGNLLVGLYFAAVSLLLWCQAARIRRVRLTRRR